MAKRSKSSKGFNRRLVFLIAVLLAVVAYAVYYFMFSASYSADSTTASCPKWKTCVKFSSFKKKDSGSFNVQLIDITTKSPKLPIKKSVDLSVKVGKKDCGSFGTPDHGKTGGCKSISNTQKVKTDNNGTFKQNISLYEITQENFKSSGKTRTTKFYVVSLDGSDPHLETGTKTYGFWVWRNSEYSITGNTKISVSGRTNTFTASTPISSPFTSKTNLDSANNAFNRFKNKTIYLKIKPELLP